MRERDRVEISHLPLHQNKSITPNVNTTTLG